MSETLEALERTTYRVEHNPNCPSPFLVRLVGWGKGSIDGKPVPHPLTREDSEVTFDAYGYGRTFEEAGEAALQARYRQKKAGPPKATHSLAGFPL